MNSDRSIQFSLQAALLRRYAGQTDAKGYVRTPADNLIAGVSLAQFEADLQSGDGDELHRKFRAVHSSSALAVNCFAWFKPAGRLDGGSIVYPSDSAKTTARLPLLTILNSQGACTLSFESKFPIFRGGKAPNLDVWIDREEEAIAIESKLSEYFVRKRPSFSPAYDRLAPPGLAEPCWWQVYEQAKQSEPCYLDIAQLVKHYFGLRMYQQRTDQTKRLLLLYLFWEPLNWPTIPACQLHRQELAQLTTSVQDSEIYFESMTYTQLWTTWEKIPELAQHTRNLKNRYEVIL